MCKMREEFEEWECNADTGPLTDPMWLMRDACSPKNYGIVQVQHDWEVWQASRAALRIELPSDTRIRNEDMSRFSVKDACQEAIEASGVKVQL